MKAVGTGHLRSSESVPRRNTGADFFQKTTHLDFHVKPSNFTMNYDKKKKVGVQNQTEEQQQIETHLCATTGLKASGMTSSFLEFAGRIPRMC